MSSESFDQVVWTEENMHAAFYEAKKAASWNPEEGTIADSYGTQEYYAERPLTLTEAYKIVNAQIMGMSRSSICKAIPLISAKSVVERLVVRKLKITAKAIEEAGSLNAAIVKVAAESVTLRNGEHIDNISVTRDPKTHKSNLTKKFKTVVETVEGKTELRYFVTQNGNHAKFVWENGFKTLAAARKELTRVATANSNQREDVVNFEVISQTMREDGSPLLRAVNKVVGAEVEVRVRVFKISENPQRGGWLFFGWLYV